MFTNFADHKRDMLSSAFNAISQLEEWEFLSSYTPPDNRGFMWDTNERINKINNKINELYGGHSGASLAWTMRHMERIAKNNEWKVQQTN